jgi:cell division transport system ATP-binding protein
VVTHDREMVDKMRRRVIQLYDGRVIRDQAAGLYTTDESTEEFGARVRTELGVDFGDDDDGDNGAAL